MVAMKIALLILGFALLLFGGFYLSNQKEDAAYQSSDNNSITSPENNQKSSSTEHIFVIGLDIPWDMVFLPDNSLLVTERGGTVRLIDSQGQLQEQPLASIDAVKAIGEGGLLGIALHPNFANNNHLYLYYTYQGSGNNTSNRVSRFTYANNRLTDEQVIVDAIPGAVNHNGGRIAFGPDNYLYITTGDAQEPSQAQNTDSLAGKILRVTDAGEVPPDNPFNNPVYSYGHRNPQGIAWDNQGNLWATEHGRSGIKSGYDELNLIQKGQNYGWPVIQGPETQEGMISPAFQSGPDTTWAPAGLVSYDGNLYFAGLRGQALYRANLNNQSVTNVIPYLQKQYGRLRAVILGPDNSLLVSTSNRDGRGNPIAKDDRIVQLYPDNLD